MDWRSVGLMCLYGALALCIPKPSYAQLAHPGYSGLISTPNAEVLPEGHFATGLSWINGPNTYLFSPKTNRVYVTTIGILPGLEATLRLTQVIGWHDPEAPGVQHAFDRMFSAKYIFPMPEGFPQAAIGMQDIASSNFLSGVKGVSPGVTQYGQTMLYGVIGGKSTRWAWHGGVGGSQSFINGLFGGITYYPLEQLSLLGEWDSRGLNWGIRVTPLNGWSILVSSINPATWGISAGLNVSL